MAANGNPIRVERSGPAGRYVLPLEKDAEAELLFHERTAGVIAITYVEVPFSHRGNGLGERLVEHAVREAHAIGHKVVPLCSFARRVFEAHPEWTEPTPIPPA